MRKPNTQTAVKEPPAAPPAVDSAPAAEGIRPRHQFKPEQFWKFVEAYDKTAKTLFYVYRCFPKIVQTPKNIEKNTELTQDALLHRWGSGIYDIRFTDANRKPNEVCRTILKLDDADYPPVIAPGTLDEGHPDNASFVANLRGRGLLKKEEDMADQSALTVAVEKLGEMATQSMRDKSKPAPDSENGLVKTLLEQNAALSGKLADRAAAPSSGSDVLVKALMEQNTALMTVLVQRAAPAPAADPFEQYSKIADIVDRAAARQSGGGPSWLEMLAPAMPALAALLTRLMSAPAAAPAGAPATVDTTLPAAAPESQIPGEFMNVLGMMGISPAQAPEYLEVGKLALASIKRGQRGDAFVSAICDLYGSTGEQICEKFYDCGKEGLVQLAAQLGAQMGLDPTAVEKWIDEFFLAFQEGEEPPAAEPK
jgi:hypothetical protein